MTAEEEVARIVEAKRASVGIGSTVLDPLPGTRTEDTALILSALDRARLRLDALALATGMPESNADVRLDLSRAAERVRERIRQEP